MTNKVFLACAALLCLYARPGAACLGGGSSECCAQQPCAPTQPMCHSHDTYAQSPSYALPPPAPSYVQAPAAYVQPAPSYAQAQPSYAQAQPSYAQAQQAPPSYAQVQQAPPSYAQAQQAPPSYAQAQQAPPTYIQAQRDPVSGPVYPIQGPAPQIPVAASEFTNENTDLVAPSYHSEPRPEPVPEPQPAQVPVARIDSESHQNENTDQVNQYPQQTQQNPRHSAGSYPQQRAGH